VDGNVSNRMETYLEFFGTDNKEFFLFSEFPKVYRLPELEEVPELKKYSEENLPELVEFLGFLDSLNPPVQSVIYIREVRIAFLEPSYQAPLYGLLSTIRHTL
jgi:hypothetical protein